MSKYFGISEIPNYKENWDRANTLCEWLDVVNYHWVKYCVKRRLYYPKFQLLPPQTDFEYNGYRVDFTLKNKEFRKFQDWLDRFFRNNKYAQPFNTIYFCNCTNGNASFYHIELFGENGEQDNNIIPLNTKRNNETTIEKNI